MGGVRVHVHLHAGKINERELLEWACPLRSTGCFAYYAIAIKSLAAGDREKAKEFFQKTRETRMVTLVVLPLG